MGRNTKDFLEFFSGIGLVREGLAPGGWRCVFANDNDERKNGVYLDRFPDDGVLCRDDVNDTGKILAGLPKQAFLATSSFPCVDLSRAGSKKGLSGKHSSAFHGFVRVLRGLGRRTPKVVLLENVPGLLVNRGGTDFRIVTQEIAGLGYYLDAFVLNASHFTPQNRQRIFIVGVTKELKPGRVIGGDGPLPDRPAELTTARLDKLIRETPLTTGWVRFPLPAPPSIRKTLLDVVDLDEGAKWWPDPKVDKIFRQIPDNHRRILREKLVSRTTWAGTIRTNHRDGRTWADLRLDGLAGAILTPRAAGGRQILVVTKDGRLLMRWLTAKEYSRLQGSSSPTRMKVPDR
jgi:DNA (cytosine-5)-methyltransferase 1